VKNFDPLNGRTYEFIGYGPRPGRPVMKNFGAVEGKIIELKVKELEQVDHIILNWPLRCWAQLQTAFDLAWQHRAVVHLTEVCAFSLRPPGEDIVLTSGCVDSRGTCNHNLKELREEGAINITPDTECKPNSWGYCPWCKGRWSPSGYIIGPAGDIGAKEE
jgi:hypothetical protein